MRRLSVERFVVLSLAATLALKAVNSACAEHSNVISLTCSLDDLGKDQANIVHIFNESKQQIARDIRRIWKRLPGEVPEDHFPVEDSEIFYSNYCLEASTALYIQLEKRGVHARIVFSGEHVFLYIPSLQANREGLVVDPTYRQFFKDAAYRKYKDPSTMKQALMAMPEILIASPHQYKRMFYSFRLQSDLAEPSLSSKNMDASLPTFHEVYQNSTDTEAQLTLLGWVSFLAPNPETMQGSEISWR